jgi:hypothetical protein
MSEDDFDPLSYGLPPGTKSAKMPARGRIAKRKEQFVKVPMSVIDAVSKSIRDKTYPVLIHLLHESWKAHGKPVKVPNEFLAGLGISRHAKTEALKKLERAGVISVKRRPGKSPVVKIVGGGPHQN